MSSTQQNREIEIITPLGTDVLLLREMTITEELGRLFSINVELGSTEDINFEDLLGQNVSVRLNSAQTNAISMAMSAAFRKALVKGVMQDIMRRFILGYGF